MTAKVIIFHRYCRESRKIAHLSVPRSLIPAPPACPSPHATFSGRDNPRKFDERTWPTGDGSFILPHVHLSKLRPGEKRKEVTPTNDDMTSYNISTDKIASGNTTLQGILIRNLPVIRLTTRGWLRYQEVLCPQGTRALHRHL